MVEAGQAIFLPGGWPRTFASAGGTIHAMLEDGIEVEVIASSTSLRFGSTE